MRSVLIICLPWLGLVTGRGDSTIDPAASFVYAANAGWINLRPTAAEGAVLGQYICQGHLWAANLGWISLGSGTPSNGMRYSNQNAGDFGVNHDGLGHLSGYAYGANIGWIQFEPKGNPTVDFSTGRLNGHIWSANMGWISLSGVGFETRTLSFAPGRDSNANGIPDAWELEKVGSLDLLKMGGDLDGDGVLDEDEYHADTNPKAKDNFLHFTGLILSASDGLAHLSFTASQTRIYHLQSMPVLESNWLDASLKAEISGESGVFHTPLNGLGSQGFFRVVASLPLAP